MRQSLDETHDATRVSWVASANEPTAEFPLQNLPFCIFRRLPASAASVGVGIGDQVLDLAAALHIGLVKGDERLHAAAAQPELNAWMQLPSDVHAKARKNVFELLDAQADFPLREQVAQLLVPLDAVELMLPVDIGDYTDFLTSAWHTERHGRFKGLQDPLPKAFFSLPIAYHGRASSIRVSGAPVHPPAGRPAALTKASSSALVKRWISNWSLPPSLDKAMRWHIRFRWKARTGTSSGTAC